MFNFEERLIDIVVAQTYSTFNGHALRFDLEYMNANIIHVDKRVGKDRIKSIRDYVNTHMADIRSLDHQFGDCYSVDAPLKNIFHHRDLFSDCKRHIGRQKLVAIFDINSRLIDLVKIANEQKYKTKQLIYVRLSATYTFYSGHGAPHTCCGLAHIVSPLFDIKLNAE